MQKNVILASCFAALFGLFALPSTASATLLTTTATPIGAETISGGALIGTQTYTYSNSSGDTGTVTEDVYSGATVTGSAFTPTLSFVFTVDVTGNYLQTFSTSSYAGFAVDAGLVSSPDATLVVSGNQTGPTGTSVGMGFADSGTASGLLEGSVTFVLNTTAKYYYNKANVSLIDDGPISVPAGIWLGPTNNPALATPEPSSMTLCASCFMTLGVGGVFRRLRGRRSGSEA
jgi:hypothetical protein